MAIEGADLIKAAAFLGAGIAMGLGAIGPGVGEGFVGGKACAAIGHKPEEAGWTCRAEASMVRVSSSAELSIP